MGSGHLEGFGEADLLRSLRFPPTLNRPPRCRRPRRSSGRMSRERQSPRRAEIGEEDFRPPPVALSQSSERSRSFSKGTASRIGASASNLISSLAARLGCDRPDPALPAGFSCRLGNSLAPVSTSRRFATLASRVQRASWQPCAESGFAQCGERTARFFDLLKLRPGRLAKLLRQRSRCRLNLPLDLTTLARLDSSSRMSCVLRAVRRAKHPVSPVPAYAGAR